MRNATKFITAGLALIGALSFSTISIAAPSYAAKVSADKSAIPSTSGFSGVPGKAAGGPDVQRSRFTYQTGPGQSIHDYFYVSNVGSEPIDLRVYAADGSTAQNGSFDVGVATDQPKDVGSWVRFQNGQPQLDVHLKVGQSKTLPFDLTIPANATPGDHVGGMAVSTVASTDGQIKIERRVVTRLYAWRVSRKHA
jgi:dihydroorotate dehydrogenase (fumarate)